MNHDDNLRRRIFRIKIYILWGAVAWTVIVAASLLWNIDYAKKQTMAKAGVMAEIALEKDAALRTWVAFHGGVYVPVTGETRANPYLNVPERDETIGTGKRITLMNPAYVMRQYYEKIENKTGVKGHITSLKPLRPENKPDPWEDESLEGFETGKKEATIIQTLGGTEYVRLMKPFVTAKECLKCHAAQGYKEGDIRGGISVSVPMAPLRNFERNQIASVSGFHALFLGLGFVGMFVFGNRILRNEHLRSQVEQELRISEDKMSKVFHASPDWITVTTLEEGRYVEVNDAFVVMTGHSRDDVIGKNAEELGLWSNPGIGSKALEMLREQGALHNFEVDLRMKSENIRTMLWSAEKIEIKGQHYVVNAVKDITESRKSESHIRKLNQLQMELLAPDILEKQLQKITDGVVDIFNADFCRIWLIAQGDRCTTGCPHAAITEGPHVCRYRDRCLHLVASSGRYTHLDGETHRRVPFGCYKIGGIASGEYPSFLTNNVTNDPRVHNHEWAKQLGLVSFAGVQLRPPHGEAIGVLALFSQSVISDEEYSLLEGVGNLTMRVMQTAEAQEAVHESERKYRALVETTNTGFVILDLAGTVIDANDEYARLTGHEHRDEILGRSLLEWTAAYDRERNAKAVEDCAREGFLRNFEIDYVGPQGQIIPIEGNGTLVATKSGTQLLALCRDITERKRTEEELLFKTALLEAQSESSIDGILVVNPEGKAISFNKRFGRMWQVPEEVLQKKDDEKILSRALELLKDPKAFIEKVQYLYSHRLKESRDELELKDGRAFDRYSSPLVDGNGNYQGRIWYFRDITEPKRAEEEREALIHELQDALKEVKALSGLLPICASCKKIRDDKGYWMQIESYISDHSEAEFSHGICPACAEKLYPEVYRKMYPESSDEEMKNEK